MEPEVAPPSQRRGKGDGGVDARGFLRYRIASSRYGYLAKSSNGNGMKTWTTLALHGPNRWSSRSVLELHATPGIALRPVSASLPADVDRLLREFLDSGQYTTTHPESVSCARGALSQIGAAMSHGALWGGIAHWMTAMAGVPSRYLSVLPWQDATGSNGMLAIAALEMEEERLSLRAYEVASEMIEEMEAKGDYPIASRFRELFDWGPVHAPFSMPRANERSLPIA
jgi:hypothetical protein